MADGKKKEDPHISIAEGAKLRRMVKEEVAESVDAPSISNEDQNAAGASGVSNPVVLEPSLPLGTVHFKRHCFYAVFTPEEEKDDFYICQFMKDSNSNNTNKIPIKWFKKNEDGHYVFEMDDRNPISQTVITKVKLKVVDPENGVYELPSDEEHTIQIYKESKEKERQRQISWDLEERSKEANTVGKKSESKVTPEKKAKRKANLSRVESSEDDNDDDDNDDDDQNDNKQVALRAVFQKKPSPKKDIKARNSGSKKKKVKQSRNLGTSNKMVEEWLETREEKQDEKMESDREDEKLDSSLGSNKMVQKISGSLGSGKMCVEDQLDTSSDSTQSNPGNYGNVSKDYNSNEAMEHQDKSDFFSGDEVRPESSASNLRRFRVEDRADSTLDADSAALNDSDDPMESLDSD